MAFSAPTLLIGVIFTFINHKLSEYIYTCTWTSMQIERMSTSVASEPSISLAPTNKGSAAHLTIFLGKDWFLGDVNKFVRLSAFSY